MQGRWSRTLPPPEGPISASISPGSHEPEMSNSTCRESRERLQRSSTQTASQYVTQLDEQVGAAAAAGVGDVEQHGMIVHAVVIEHS